MLKKVGIVTALWAGIPTFATAAVFLSRPLTPDIVFLAISFFMRISVSVPTCDGM
ncbi:hypothetical protein HYDPIDRAFT_35090 [Hydnomerulius pinastri MD-312]|uniref:Uncharacterized protein n=1 Tax=Hydnomerulius pinastri MD-312 TaxID=994086 RepID=A0A0C2PWK0_9AGAM|nr:hypothetical protein HYDPIDRAFT_35090 [Hydnomerulius pinastri MD-312]